MSMQLFEIRYLVYCFSADTRDPNEVKYISSGTKMLSGTAHKTKEEAESEIDKQPEFDEYYERTVYFIRTIYVNKKG